MKTVSRMIGNNDAARVKAALHGKVRFAEQRDGENTQLIFLAEEGQEAANIIAAELER